MLTTIKLKLEQQTLYTKGTIQESQDTQNRSQNGNNTNHTSVKWEITFVSFHKKENG